MINKCNSYVLLLLLLYARAQITTCAEGFDCTTGVAQASGYYSLDGDAACHPCPAGYQCPSGGTPVVCSDGAYSEYGISSCTACPLGYTCVGGIKTACITGYYTPSTGSTSCSSCPQNNMCPDKKSAIACTGAGEWSPSGST
jgi:hypothetical protein